MFFFLGKHTTSKQASEEHTSFKLTVAANLVSHDETSTDVTPATSIQLDNEEMFVFEEENTDNLDESSDTETVNVIEKIMDQFDYTTEGISFMIIITIHCR